MCAPECVLHYRQCTVTRICSNCLSADRFLTSLIHFDVVRVGMARVLVMYVRSTVLTSQADVIPG